MTQPTLKSITDKVHAGERLTFEDGVFLENEVDILTLGELANTVRERKNGNLAFYNTNIHLNPTNVCVYRCTCLLYTSPSPRDATLSRMPSSA